MITWGDLNARARGLGSHLLSRRQLEMLIDTSPDVPSLALELSALGFPVPGEPRGAAPELLELAVRRRAARALATLARWAGPRHAALAVVFEDEDRRSLRALVRGAIQGASAPSRIAGLVPTPGLPERALAELARQPSVGAVATLLVLWEHPHGRALLDEASRERPDPLVLELAINRSFAQRAVRTARPGGRDLRDFVATAVDLENARTALFLRREPGDLDREQAFLQGGRRVRSSTFDQVMSAETPAEASRIGALAFDGTPYRAVVERSGDRPWLLDAELLRASIGIWRRRSRVAAFGAAPLLYYVLRLRAQDLDLGRIIWGAVLGTPPQRARAALVTP